MGSVLTWHGTNEAVEILLCAVKHTASVRIITVVYWDGIWREASGNFWNEQYSGFYGDIQIYYLHLYKTLLAELPVIVVFTVQPRKSPWKISRSSLFQFVPAWQ